MSLGVKRVNETTRILYRKGPVADGKGGFGKLSFTLFAEDWECTYNKECGGRGEDAECGKSKIGPPAHPGYHCWPNHFTIFSSLKKYFQLLFI